MALDPDVFSARDVKQMTENYKSCLVCATCEEEAILKCKGCKVARYCSQTCQDKNFSKHREECSLLLEEHKKKEVQESLRMKQIGQGRFGYLFNELENWEIRIPYEVWEKKFTYMVNLKARESIGMKKEMDVCVQGVETLMRSKEDYSFLD